MKTLKWNDLYKNESELINDMMKTKSDEKKHIYYKLVKGYKYIESFKKYYIKNGKLTDKQMIQLKRLSRYIYENVHNNNLPICPYKG